VRSVLLSQREIRTLLADTSGRASEHVLERLQHIDEMAHPDNAVAAYGIVLRTWPQRDCFVHLNSQLGDIEWRRKSDLFWSISLLSEGRDACEDVCK